MLKKLFYIFIILMVLVTIVYFIVSLNLKPFLLKKISQGLGTKVECKSMALSFPLNAEFKGLVIFDKEGKDKILLSENVKIGLNPFSFFNQRILLNHFILIRPKIKLERNPDNSLNILNLLKMDKKAETKTAKSLLALRIEIKDGQIEFLDKSIFPAMVTAHVDNLNLKIAKVSLPITSTKVNFNISFDLVNLADQVKGSLLTEGWINIIKKDISANLEVKNFDITYFKPYYKGGFSAIENGILNLNSEITAKNNDLTLNNTLELNYLSLAEGESPSSNLFGISIQNFVDYLKDSQGKIEMCFILQGKADRPQELISKLEAVIINNILEKVVSSQMQRLIEYGEKTTEGTGTFKDKTQESFQDIKKALEGIFKQE